MPETRATRPNLRPLWMVIGSLVLAAAALWLSSRLTWTWSRHTTALRGAVVDARPGSAVTSALVPLAVLALAAIAAVLAIGGWGRRVVGVVVGFAGLAAIWTGTGELSAVFAAQPPGYPGSQVFFGHALALLAGLLMVFAGVMVVRAASRLPRLGAGYQTPGGSARRRDPDTELWHALSEGRDPTANE